MIPRSPEPADATVRIGDTTRAWHADLDLARVVAEAGAHPASVATALNGRFVPREQRAQVCLAPGDEVVLVRAIVGG